MKNSRKYVTSIIFNKKIHIHKSVLSFTSNCLDSRWTLKSLSENKIIWEDIEMFEKILIAVVTGIILEIFRIILKKLVELIKDKLTSRR